MNIMDRFANANEYEKTYDEKKMSQKSACLDYLERYGSITPLEALSAFRCFRLSAIIYRLREEGYVIKTHINDDGKPYAIYVLMKEGEEYDG